VYWLFIAWFPRLLRAGASVKGSALVFCGRDVLFLGGRNVCAIFLCTYSFSVLIHWSRYWLGHPRTFYRGQVKTGVRGSCEAWNGFF
jgi:hypothetical protein